MELSPTVSRTVGPFQANRVASPGQTKSKPVQLEDFGESAIEQIKTFKQKLNTVTEKYLQRIESDPVANILPTYARIVIKMIVELTGQHVFQVLVKKTVKKSESQEEVKQPLMSSFTQMNAKPPIIGFPRESFQRSFHKSPTRRLVRFEESQLSPQA